MPGETIEIYVDADENSVLPLVTFAQVGVVDESSPNNHRQSLKVGRNVITAPSTGTHGYAVYFTNRALPEEQNYAPRARIVSDKLQAYPLYIHGKTDPQTFIEQVKNHTGEDMAEVMGERFLLSSRNSEAKIAYIDNGKSPLDAVDSMEKIIAAFDKLSGYDPNDSNPVHHPTNTLYHYKATNTSGLYASNEYIHYSLSSSRKLFAGDTSDWGIGHEFGHQIENSDMRLIEVTNNLYSIVAQKAVYGEVLRSFSWNQGNIDNYFTFEGTKGFGGFGETYELTFGLFERLSVLQQVLNYFGDEAYANAARLVRENPSLYNSTGSHQTLITAMSAATGYDLSSHFEYFNYPVTEATKEFTSHFLPLDKKIRYTIMDTYKYIENDIETFNDETKAVITSITRDADGFTLNFGTSDNNEGTIAYEIYRDGEMVGFTRTGTFKDIVDPSKDYDYQIVAFDYRVNECRSEVVRPHLPKIEGVEDITLNIRDLKTFNKMLRVSATNMIGSNLNVEVQETTIEAPQPGTEAIYTLIYSVTDEAGQTVTKERKVTVTNYLPTIEGIDNLIIKAGDTFEKLAGVTANDTEDGVITQIEVDGEVKTTEVGTYILTYKVTDQDGNTTTVERTITVRSNDKPTIEGIDNVTIKVGDTFDVLAGVTAKDTEDGEIKQITVTGDVDTTQVGKYTLTYEVTDKDGNKTTVERTVTVKNIDESQEGFNPSIDSESNNTGGESVDKPNNELDEEVNQNNSTNNNNQSNSPTTGMSSVLGGFGLFTMLTGFTQIFNKKNKK